MQDFFALFFELFGTLVQDSSDDLYEHIYLPAGFFWIFLTLGWVLLFYQGFVLWRRKAKFDTRVVWLIWMLISSLLTTTVVWIFTDVKLANEALEYGFTDYAHFLCIVFFWCLVLYFVYSLVLKYSNPSRRKIPF